jgi:hypothetical protein
MQRVRPSSLRLIFSIIFGPSFASASSPLLASYLLAVSSFGWPLIIADMLECTYDLLLPSKFWKLRLRARHAQFERCAG